MGPRSVDAEHSRRGKWTRITRTRGCTTSGTAVPSRLPRAISGFCSTVKRGNQMIYLPRQALLAIAVFGTLAAGCGQTPPGASVNAAEDGSTPPATSPSASQRSSVPSDEVQGQGNLQVDRREDVSLDQARQRVDFPVAPPPATPAGWEPAGSQLIDYDADSDGVPDANHYLLSFRPKGADEAAHAGLSIRQATDTGRPDDFDALETTRLDDGTVAHLTDPPEDAPGGAVTWWRNGGYYTVSAHGLSLDRLVTIANQLNANLGD